MNTARPYIQVVTILVLVCALFAATTAHSRAQEPAPESSPTPQEPESPDSGPDSSSESEAADACATPVACTGTPTIGDDEDPSDYETPDQVLEIAGSAAASVPIVTPGDPIYCEGMSHNPHKSKHNPGKVAAKGVTRCPAFRQMRVEAWLYQFVPEENIFYLRDTGSSTDEYFKNSFWRVSKRLLAPCAGTPTTYRLVSRHTVWFLNGESRTGDTSNTQVVDC